MSDKNPWGVDNLVPTSVYYIATKRISDDLLPGPEKVFGDKFYIDAEEAMEEKTKWENVLLINMVVVECLMFAVKEKTEA